MNGKDNFRVSHVREGEPKLIRESKVGEGRVVSETP